MKKPYFAFLLLTAVLQSQTFQWLQTTAIDLNLNPELIGYGIAPDPSGNIYVCGYKDTPTPYNDIFGQLLYNKYNGDGELQYSNTLSGKGAFYDIAVDGNGAVILALGYLNTITIGTLTLNTTDQGIQPLVVKLDKDGNLLWHYIPMIDDMAAGYCKAITTDDAGNIFVGYDDFNASYITKLSSEGVPLFTITQLNAKLLSSLDTDSEGNIYAAGSCAEPNAIYAGVAAPTTFDYNTWLVKYSPTGAYQWVRYVEDITCSHPEVKVDSPDNIYYSSYLFGAYSFGSLTAMGPASGSFNDFFVAKLNASGTFQWVREVPAAGVVNTGKRNYLETDTAGNVYFTGSTRGAVDWGNGITTTANGFGSDMLVLKYNTNGVLQFAKTAGGNSEDRFDGITVNANGDLYVSGLARGNAAFDAITHTSTGIIPYPIIAKINSGVLGAISHELQAIKLYPNPAGDYFYINSVSKTNGTIYNVLGQRVRDFESDANTPVAVGDLPKGIYLVKAISIEGKFIKE